MGRKKMDAYSIYLVWPVEQTKKVDMSAHMEKIRKYASIRKTLPVAQMLVVLVKQDWETRLLDYCDEEALIFTLIEKDLFF